MSDPEHVRLLRTLLKDAIDAAANASDWMERYEKDRDEELEKAKQLRATLHQLGFDTRESTDEKRGGAKVELVPLPSAVATTSAPPFWKAERKGVMTTTTDGKPPELGTDAVSAPGYINPATGQHSQYWVLAPEERAKGFVRPVRRSYVHVRSNAGALGLKGCGTRTTMGDALAETYAANPKFYGQTFCVGCKVHLPVDQFDWADTDEAVGS